MPDTSSTNEAAASLLRLMRDAPPREPGEKLRWQDKARMLQLKADGQTQEEIAATMGCHQSTVSRTLADLDDSRPFARKPLEASAVSIVESILTSLKTASVADQVKLLGKLDVVRDDRERHPSSPSTWVMVGTPGHPIPIEPKPTPPLWTNTLTGEVRPAQELSRDGGTAILIGVAPPGTPHNPTRVTEPS